MSKGLAQLIAGHTTDIADLVAKDLLLDIDIAALVAADLTFLKLDGSRAMTGNLEFVSALIKDVGSDTLAVRNIADSAYGHVAVSNLSYAVAGANIQNARFHTMYNNNNGQLLFQSWYGGAWNSVAIMWKGRFESIADHYFYYDSVGPVLIDRTTATKYRLYVDDGVLLIEAV